MQILVHIHSPFATWNIPPAHLARLREAFPAHTFLHARDDQEALGMMPEVEVAFSSQITREHLQASPRLRWIHSPATGVGSMLFPELVEHSVLVTNSRGMSADTMAEHVVAVTLALLRHLPLAVLRQSQRTWAQDEIAARGNRTVDGSAVLIVGLGSIGAAVAHRMTALGARVTGIRRHVDAEPVPGVAAVLPPVRLREAIAGADVIVITAPHTRDTRGLIGPAELGAMKPAAVLVNVSRGPLVDEHALAAALQAGHLAGAALDVFDDEPLPEDNPLWSLPNVLITPHTSAARLDHWRAATDLFAENLRRFERGDELMNVVDKKRGY